MPKTELLVVDRILRFLRHGFWNDTVAVTIVYLDDLPPVVVRARRYGDVFVVLGSELSVIPSPGDCFQEPSGVRHTIEAVAVHAEYVCATRKEQD